MSDNSGDEIAKLIGWAVITLSVILALSYLTFHFYYVFVVGGGVFSAYIAWKIKSEETKSKPDKAVSALIGFLIGAVGVLFIIAVLYGSNPPWAK